MVYILLAPGFEEMEALIPADLMRRAGLEVSLVTLGEKLVPGGRGIPVQCDRTLEEVSLEDMQALVFPGGGVGVANLGADPRVERLTRAAWEKGSLISAICAAPSLLSRWGMLAGKKAVCYPTWRDKLSDADYQAGAKLALDGNILTGQAAGASFQFGLKLVELLVDEQTAQRVEREICL